MQQPLSLSLKDQSMRQVLSFPLFSVVSILSNYPIGDLDNLEEWQVHEVIVFPYMRYGCEC